jgi:asparagine synthase (glutamine-hydrolysing)
VCGIAGWAGSVAADEAVLRRMCQALRHRGPDDEGYHVEPGRVGLGFRRLSIIDLEWGNQPLFDEHHGTAVTCNGEIYNFQALRADLERRGHTFRTGSDVETIVHLHEERGTACLEALRGMFAIALWDPAEQRLLLARDRLGVKPLYWAPVPGGIVYGSEPAAILASGLVPARPDPAAIAQYLTLQYVPPPLTGFEGIRKLAPGELLTFHDGDVRVERWWRLDHAAKAPPRAEEELLDELDALLREATRLRLIADVPVGAFLSGGIDSSLVVSYMAELSDQAHTFSIDFGPKRYSEGAHARRVAELYGTAHEELLVEPDIVPTALETVRHAGEPFADSSAIPTYVLSEATRRRVTVALSGDGGDEAFAGYVRHRLAVAADRLDPLPRLARPLAGAVPRRGAALGRIGRGLDVMGRAPDDRYAAMMSHFEPAAVRRLCEPEFLRAAGGPAQAWERVLVPPPQRGVDRYLALDTATYLPGDLLLKVDRMSMAHALEVRSPLLDHEVHEFAASLPGDVKLRRRTTKWLLKQLARRRGLPEDLVDRPKQGFGVPIPEWFRRELRGWVEDVLRDPRTRARGYFRPAESERLLADHVSGRRNHANELWNLAMLELWHRAWIDSGALPPGRRRRSAAVDAAREPRAGEYRGGRRDRGAPPGDAQRREGLTRGRPALAAERSEERRAREVVGPHARRDLAQLGEHLEHAAVTPRRLKRIAERLRAIRDAVGTGVVVAEDRRVGHRRAVLPRDLSVTAGVSRPGVSS